MLALRPDFLRVPVFLRPEVLLAGASEPSVRAGLRLLLDRVRRVVFLLPVLSSLDGSLATLSAAAVLVVCPERRRPPRRVRFCGVALKLVTT